MGRARKPIGGSAGGMSPEVKSIVLITVVAVAALAWWKSRSTDEAEGGDEAAATSAAAGGSSSATAPAVAYALDQPAKGAADAPAVLVKFTDFQ